MNWELCRNTVKTEKKHKKMNLNLNQQSAVRTARVCKSLCSTQYSTEQFS